MFEKLVGETIINLFVCSLGNVSIVTKSGMHMEILRNDSILSQVAGENVRKSPIVFADVDYEFEERECGGFIEVFTLIAANGNKLVIEYLSANYGCTYYSRDEKGATVHVHA